MTTLSAFHPHGTKHLDFGTLEQELAPKLSLDTLVKFYHAVSQLIIDKFSLPELKKALNFGMLMPNANTPAMQETITIGSQRFVTHHPLKYHTLLQLVGTED
jgi:hypothetical protein